MPSAAQTKATWTKVAFGDVVRLAKDRSRDPVAEGIERYVGLEHLEPGQLRIRDWGLVADGTTFTNRFRPGQVLFGKRRAYQRKVAVADFEGICSGDIYVLEPRDDRLLPELLPYICQTDAFFEHAVGTSAGSLSPRTNWKSLASFEFALPPVEEQRRIAAALKSLDDLRAKLGEGVQSIMAVRSAVFNEVMSAAGHRDALVPVEALLLEGPRNGVSPRASDEPTAFRTVSISAVREGRFDPDGCVKYADIDFGRIESFLVRESDVFVVRGNGNRALVGRAGLSRYGYQDLFYPDLLIRLRFDPERILPEFAVEQWDSPVAHQRLLARSKSSNGIYKVNGRDIREHELWVPTLAVQESVMERVRVLREASDLARARISSLDDLYATLLAESVGGGNLRVL